MSKFLLVDGHSVIFAWSELRSIHQRDRRQAREQLTKLLDELHDTSEWSVTLVFDGKEGSSLCRRESDMVVLFAKSHQTADSIIERLVGQVSKNARERVTVVTADGGERATVESMGACCHTPDWLRWELEQTGEHWKSMMRRVHGEAEW